MSRHRATGPPLPQLHTEASVPPGTADPPNDALADLLGHDELEWLCGMVYTFPGTAERFLTEDRVPDPVVRYTLGAEAALRLDRPRVAKTLAFCAVDHGMHMQPVDPGRLLPAVTVLADACVLAGAPDAIGSCLGLGVLADRFRDEHRVTVAAGLHAVAVYQQQGCRQAMVLLDRLHRGCTDSGIAGAIDLACETIATCCARRRQPHWPPPSPPQFSAGGQVQPVLSPAFLADRFMRWPGIHDCSSPAG